MEEITEALAAARNMIAGDPDLDAAQLTLGIEAFLAACGLQTSQVIEASTPSAKFGQFTGAAPGLDFLVHAETFPPGSVTDPASAQAHICSAPVAVVRYVEGTCPRCGSPGHKPRRKG